MSAILRPHQERLLEQIDAAINGGCRRIVAQAPTGFGKTIVAAHRLRHLQDTGKRAMFIVPALSLIDQSVEKLYAEGVRDVGGPLDDELCTANPGCERSNPDAARDARHR